MKKIIIGIFIIIIILFMVIRKIEKPKNTFNISNKNQMINKLIETKKEEFLSGSYEWVPTTITTNCIFYFSPEGKVVWAGDAYSVGTYKIENHQVLLLLDKTLYTGDILIEDEHREITLNIVDERTLSDEHGELFKKVSDENVLIEQQKQLEQMIEQNAN